MAKENVSEPIGPVDHNEVPQAPELTIWIWQGHVRWEGTPEQLTSEGLVPPIGFDWNRGVDAYWESGGFKLEIRAPKRKKDRDCNIWSFSFWDAGRRPLTHEDVARANLQRAIWRDSPEGQAHWKRWYKASEDVGFQSFLVRAGAKKLRKKPGRKSRSQHTS